MCYMLVALSTSTYARHVGGRNGRGEKLDSAFVRREDSFWRTGDRQACLNACAKPATTCKQLHEMSVAASLVGDVDA